MLVLKLSWKMNCDTISENLQNYLYGVNLMINEGFEFREWVNLKHSTAEDSAQKLSNLCQWRRGDNTLKTVVNFKERVMLKIQKLFLWSLKRKVRAFYSIISFELSRILQESWIWTQNGQVIFENCFVSYTCRYSPRFKSFFTMIQETHKKYYRSP